MLNWHRLFGLFLIDYFTDSPYVVELEKDLSIKQQFLDVVVLRKGPGGFQGQLPDGLDNFPSFPRSRVGMHSGGRAQIPTPERGNEKPNHPLAPVP